MTQPCTVLIAASELLPALKERTAEQGGELLAFTDTDALQALEVIMKRRPSGVVLEGEFAATPRGAALINRIRADPSLADSEIRIIAHDNTFTRVASRRPGDGPGRSAAAVAAAPAAAPTAPLDQRGTRRAPRFRMTGHVDVLVDGNPATLVDLSTLGAQVISVTVLKPNQRVRMALTDDYGNVRFNASVAWASFEIPQKGGPRYRAGLEFIDADPKAVDAYCSRHKH